MGKIIFLLVSVFFLISLVSASPLISTPNVFTFQAIKGQTKDISFNITNPNDYSLTDIKLEGEFGVSSIVSLNPNETKIINLSINMQNVGEFTRTYKITGLSEVNCSVLGVSEVLINITSNGAKPRDPQICKNDNIRFLNSYGNSIRLTISDFSIDTNIGEDSSLVQGYPNVGNFIYRVEPLIDLGTIRVVDTSQKVHRDVDDGIITLTISSILQETTLETIISKTNFNMSHDKIENSFFVIKNTGTVKAENLRFFGEWFTFDKNNIDINPGQERAVNFVLAPGISDVSQTGKEYIKQIKIVSDNVPEQIYNISIFIQFSSVITGNISTPEYWKKRLEFCKEFPTAIDCLTEPIIVFRDKEVFDCPAILVNVSPKDVQSSLQECNNLRGDFSDFSNNFKLDVDGIKTTVSDSATRDMILNDSFSKTTKNLIGFRDTFYFTFGLIFLSIIIGGISYIGKLYYNKRKNEAVRSLV